MEAIHCTEISSCIQLNLLTILSPWVTGLCPALKNPRIVEFHCRLMSRADDECSLLDRFLSNLFTWCKLQLLTDSPQSFIRGTPSVEVTHISLYFKLNVRFKALPKHMGLSTQHVSDSVWFPRKPKCTLDSSLHESLSSQAVASLLQVLCLNVERQGDFKVGQGLLLL